MSRAILIAVVLQVAACATAPTKECPTTPADEAAETRAPAIPAFPLEALQGAHAKSVKLYVNADGTFRKYTVYVAREGLPDWVHQMADKELGQGEDLEFEVEQYPDGARVYEVTRLVGGKKIELAVSLERKKLYIERKELPLEQIPAKVKAAAEGVAGLAIERYSLKERPDGNVHELHGRLGARDVSLYVADDGAVTMQTLDLPGKVKVLR